MFRATLFTIAKRWKQLKSLSTDEWIHEWNVNSLTNEWKWKCGKYTLWNIIQPLKGSEFWHMLEGEWILRMLCQVNNKYTSQKDTDCMIPLIEATQGSQVHRDRKQNGGYQGMGADGQFHLMGLQRFCLTEFQFGRWFQMKKVLEMVGQQCERI